MGVHLSEDEYRRIYAEAKTIAVVGASSNPGKPAYGIPAYLQREGYRIIPVNPRGGELFGEPVRTSLEEIGEPVDVVDVFRRRRRRTSPARPPRSGRRSCGCRRASTPTRRSASPRRPG